MAKVIAAKFEISIEEIQEMDDSYSGFCVSCGAETCGGCEPDARNYKCESCGEFEVFGSGELLYHEKIMIV